MNADEVVTALRIFADAVSSVWGDRGPLLEAALEAGAMRGPEEAI